MNSSGLERYADSDSDSDLDSFPFELNDAQPPKRLGEKSQLSKLEMAVKIVQKTHPLHQKAELIKIVPGLSWLSDALLWDKFDKFEETVENPDYYIQPNLTMLESKDGVDFPSELEQPAKNVVSQAYNVINEIRLKKSDEQEENDMIRNMSKVLSTDKKIDQIDENGTKETLLTNEQRDFLQNDPFLPYGVGIVNYFQLQRRLMCLFSIICILAAIQMCLFYAQGGLNKLGEDTALYALTSFGNMGFPKPVCGKEVLNWDHEIKHQIQFTCERSTTISDVFDVGVQLSESLPGGSDNTLASCDSNSLKPDTISYKITNSFFNREAIQ